VVDVGEHKGYFGAFALLRGAAVVLSLEPERDNFRLLELTAASFRARGYEWVTRRAAVWSEPGQATLRVDAESWSHALTALETQAAGSEVQRVERESMEALLDEARALAAGRRIMVKIDAEGAECAIVAGTPASAWASVDEGFVEVHDFAPCTSQEVVARLAGAGLERTADALNVYHFRRRPS
jgi:FkbM family methyltransferase